MLCESQIELFRIPQEVTEGEALELMTRLPEFRRVKASSYRFARDRFLCAKAYLMLCDVLRDRFGIRELPLFGYGEHGKPFLAAYPDIHFNLSHCPKAVACVVAPYPVGIDVEEIQFDEEFARRVLNDREMRRVLGAASPSVEFTSFWTKKESLLKKRGTGLTDDLPGLLEGCAEEFRTTVFEEDGFVMTAAG